MEWFEIFQYAFVIRAFIASSLVGIMCGMLGCFIILRHMALIGEALSHAILPGVVAGFLIAGYSLTGFFSGAVIAGLITAVLITWLQQNVKIKEDAAIGIVFTAMFAVGIMAISWLTRREGVHLDMQDFLFGNVLGISGQDMYLTAVIAIFVVGSILAFYRYLFITTFQPVVSRTMGISVQIMHYFLMLLLSFSVVASIQTVGVILVVAMLIIPASTAYLISNQLHRMLWYSAGFGFLAAVGGLLLAILFETTPGPAMTITAAFIYFVVVMVSPENGFLIKKYRAVKRNRKIEEEDVLKQMARLYDESRLTFGQLKDSVYLSRKRLQKRLRQLRSNKLVRYDEGFERLQLTRDGRKRAYELIRAHRLWETYLTHEMGVPGEAVHDEADKYEHMLPENLVEDIDKDLGSPKQDPHGSPIPQRGREGSLSLSELSAGDKAVILKDQRDDQLARKLWEEGITPNTPFEVLSLTADGIDIRLNDKSVRLPVELAKNVWVNRYNGE